VDGAGALGSDAPRHAAKEQGMLDPKEQAKGGFGAYVARQQERQGVIADARAEADRGARGTTDTPVANTLVTADVPETLAGASTTVPSTVSRADGDASSPYEPSTERQARRWR
jgi:hypothetical protein